MEGLGFQLRTEAVLNTLTEDVLKSSEIEGETLDRDQVRSSIARRLGIDIGGLKPSDRDVEGVVEMMLDATQNYEKPLTPFMRDHERTSRSRHAKRTWKCGLTACQTTCI
jgi:Fic family protein